MNLLSQSHKTAHVDAPFGADFFMDQGGEKTHDVSMAPSKNEGDDDMKYITKRNDGRYQASRTVDGKRIFAYGHTKVEAKCRLEEKIKLKPSMQEREPYTLGEFAIFWLQTFKAPSVSGKTYKDYQWTINAHIRPINVGLSKITAPLLQNLLNELPPTRVRKEVYKLLRQIFKKAYELELVRRDVTEFITCGKLELNSRETLQLDEQSRLMTALMKALMRENERQFAERVLFYLCTGARPSEIATVNQFELKPGWLKINGTKTSRAVRWVKISQKMYEMLKAQPFEFFNFDIKRFRQRLQRFCLDNKVCADIDTYTLRHTFATNLYILRVPEKDRQQYMGHRAGSEMTNNVYTTFSPDAKPEDVYKIYGDWLPKF